jgi:hypothetical protein
MVLNEESGVEGDDLEVGVNLNAVARANVTLLI